MMEARKFWMVYGLDRGAPTHRHNVKQDAEREAKRLAAAHPDEWFVVLESIAAVQKTSFHSITLRDNAASLLLSRGEVSNPDEELPF